MKIHINSFFTPEAAPIAEILVEENVEEGGSFLHVCLIFRHLGIRTRTVRAWPGRANEAGELVIVASQMAANAGCDIFEDLHPRDDDGLTVLRHRCSRTSILLCPVRFHKGKRGKVSLPMAEYDEWIYDATLGGLKLREGV